MYYARNMQQESSKIIEQRDADLIAPVNDSVLPTVNKFRIVFWNRQKHSTD
jgi:hypothetical protein